VTSISLAERSQRFSGTCGTHGYISKLGRTGANLHPDRCVCQGSDPTPHKHYREAPHNCARCTECDAYTPALASKDNPLATVEFWGLS
jgi:hypothetical protein